MNILFFGYHQTATPMLEIIKKSSNKIVGIILPTNRNQGGILPVKKFAKRNKIKTYQPKNRSDTAFLEEIKGLHPDLGVVFNYSHILKKELINIPKLGCINIHPSLLPKYRGAHVLNWALINGEKETGVTIHFIDEGIDTGDIINQRKFRICKNDTLLTLGQKMTKIAGNLLQETLCDFNKGRVRRKKQNESQSSYYHFRKPEDGLIDWQKPTIEIYNLVRALVKPWPGAYYFDKNGKKIVIDKFMPLSKVKKLQKNILSKKI